MAFTWPSLEAYEKAIADEERLSKENGVVDYFCSDCNQMFNSYEALRDHLHDTCPRRGE